jgi:hypothetical protein
LKNCVSNFFPIEFLGRCGVYPAEGGSGKAGGFGAKGETSPSLLLVCLPNLDLPDGNGARHCFGVFFLSGGGLFRIFWMAGNKF